MSFSTQRLVNSRVLVTGTDKAGTDGTTTLDSTQWDEVNANSLYSKAVDEFDAAVDEFFKPLLDAADKASAAKVTKPDDPSSYVVLNEAVDSVEGRPAQLVHLNSDSIVLRLIEEGNTDRLVWVEGSLEVLEAQPTSQVSDTAVYSGIYT